MSFSFHPNRCRVSKMVVNKDQTGIQPLQVVLTGKASPVEQRQMRADLLNRAETYLYVWTQ